MLGTVEEGFVFSYSKGVSEEKGGRGRLVVNRELGVLTVSEAGQYAVLDLVCQVAS